MSLRIATPPLAILLGALALACADGGSQPVGLDEPGIQAKKEYPNRSDLVTVTVNSSILNGTDTDRAASLGDGGSSINAVTLTVTDNDCSPSGVLVGKMGILTTRQGEQSAGFTFPVPVGSPRWHITFSGGSLTAGVWPPGLGESATWTYTAWELVQETPKGGPTAGDCPVSGNEVSTITVTKTGEI